MDLSGASTNSQDLKLNGFRRFILLCRWFFFSSQSTTSAHDVVVRFLACLWCPWPVCGASRRPVYTYKSPNTTILCCGARANNCKTGCRATFGLWWSWVLTDFLKHMLIYLTWLLRGSRGCRGTEQRCGVDGFLEWLRLRLRLRPLGADFDSDSYIGSDSGINSEFSKSQCHKLRTIADHFSFSAIIS